jgi:hypothetical protein
MTYPPQQGPGAYGHPDPYAQQPQQPYPPQPGYGYPQQQPYPQQPQQGYGHPQQHPGQPYPPQQQQWGAPPPPAPSPSRGGLGLKTKLKIAGGVIFAIVFAIVWFMSRDDADQAEAGDCLQNSSGSISTSDLEIVDCSDSKAVYKVVEVHSGTTNVELCQGKSDVGYVKQTSGGRRSSGTQLLLCLDNIKK